MLPKLWKRRTEQDQRSRQDAALSSTDDKFQALVVKSAEDLLTPHQALIDNLYSFSQLDAARFNATYRALFVNIASYVQLLPASERHHHSHLGGLLEHSLEVATYCGRIAGRFLYTADGEEQTMQWSALYTFAMVSAGALHDVGKALSDIDVIIIDGKGKRQWFPHHGPMKTGERYIFRYSEKRIYGLHEIAGLPLLFSLMPAKALEWVWQKPVIRNEWLASIGGKSMDLGGNIGQCVIECDSASTGEAMLDAPVAVAAEAEAMTLGQRPKIDALITQGIVKSFRDFPPNSERNPFWVTQHFVICIAPRFVDVARAALGSQAQYLPEQTSLIYDTMADAGMLILTPISKAIHSFSFSPRAKPLAAVLIHRRFLDPDNKLPVHQGRILCSSIPEELCHVVGDEKQGLATVSSSSTVPAPAPAPAPAPDDEYMMADTQLGAESSQAFTPGIVAISPEDQALNSQVRQIDFFDPAQTSIAEVEQDRSITYELTPQLTNNSAFRAYVLGDELQDRQQGEAALTVRKQLADKFIDWLKAQILSGQIKVNQPGGVLHVVSENRLAMVTPSTFNTFFNDGVAGNLLPNERRNAVKRVQHALLQYYDFCSSPIGGSMLRCTVRGMRKQNDLRVMIFTTESTARLGLSLDLSNKNAYIELHEM